MTRANVEPRTSPCCASSATSCAAAASAACSRIAPSTPGRTGSERRLRRRRARSSFYQNVRIDGVSRRARAPTDRDGDDLSYRGFFDYNGDRFGVQAERLVVEPNFLPEIGFVRRHRHAPQLRPAALQPAAEAAIPHLRRLTSQGKPELHRPTTRTVWTRASRRALQMQTEFTNSDVASVTYTDKFERLVRPFAIATGVTHSGRRLRLPHHAHRLYRAGSSARSRARCVFETGTFYNGDRTSIA